MLHTLKALIPYKNAATKKGSPANKPPTFNPAEKAKASTGDAHKDPTLSAKDIIV